MNNPAPVSGKKGRILIVDDTPTNLHLLIKMLGEENYATFPASEGAMALRFVQETPPDLILLDVRMPDMDGYHLCERLKADARTRDIPVIFISAGDQVLDKVKAFAVGGVDYIVKPFHAEEVLARVATHLALLNLRRDLEARVRERTTELLQTNARLNGEIAERRRAEEALRKSEERYRSFFEEDLAGAFISTPAGSIVACNPAFASIFGFASPAEAMAADSRLFYANLGEQAEVLARLKSGQPLQNHELELRRRDGKLVHLLANIVGVADGRGGLAEIKGYVIDVTERKKLENQLRQSQKMEAIGQLAGGMAHDFNNLLTCIISYSDLLMLEQPSLEEKTRAGLTQIKNAGLSAAALTRQLLTFSRRQLLQPRIIDLNLLIVNAEKMLHRLIGEDIKLRLQLARPLAHIKADPGQIEQIILNLSVNARDAMPHGGSLVLETTEVVSDAGRPAEPGNFPPGSYVRLTITDTGSGMDAEVQSHLFEPFFTTKGVGRGTGLGLSTVYGIVQQSRGHIFVQSEVGRGASFRIYFPAVAGDAQPAAEKKLLVQELPRGTGTILLVEDHDAVRKIARDILERCGYLVLEAAYGDDALRVAREHQGPIHLLLTDVIMPGMNGPQLAEHITAARKETKVLFMSGYTDDVIIQRGGLPAGILMLDKPFTSELFMQKVRQALGSTP
jgi:two-component system cell cycle sensor histidine kinase/response regulator CckA